MPRKEHGHFSRETFRFLQDLAENNNREWFTANRSRYEEHVKQPALRFIEAFAGPLADLAPNFEATPKSLFRIHRDTRFSGDKRPYKTHVGIHFRHRDTSHPHTPGYYLHLEPGQVFAGFGVWRPDAPTLGAIRERIVAKPEAWRKAARAKDIEETFEFEGDRLKRPPKGYPADHPLIEDLKRKDFVGMKQLSESFVTEPDLPGRLSRLWGGGTPYVRFLCDALDLPFA